MTGAGAPGGPGIIKALKKAGFELAVGDCHPLASGRALHQPFVQLPRADDAGFVPFLLAWCIEQKVDVVFPLVTRELFQLAAAKDLFNQHGVSVIVSPPGPLAIANDKGKLYQHLQQRHIPVPAFRVVQSVEELAAAAHALGYPQQPVVIKPTVSNGSRGVRILQEAIDDYALFFGQKPTHLYSRLQTICDMLRGRPLPPMLVSEYLPGPEFTVDTLVQNGEPVLVLPRSREKMNGGISVQGRFVRHAAIIDYCSQILRSFHLEGPIGLQVKADATGAFKILEINPRIQGTSTAALGMGINLPALAVQQLFEPVEINADTLPWGTGFVRYYKEAFYK